jgi:hypothetical protein
MYKQIVINKKLPDRKFGIFIYSGNMYTFSKRSLSPNNISGFRIIRTQLWRIKLVT